MMGVATVAAYAGPMRATTWAARTLSRLLARVDPDRTEALRDNLRHVRPAATDGELDELVESSLATYARYWVEMLRLPRMSASAIDAGFAVEGYEHLEASLAEGKGPTLVLPHLGGWEWAAAWLGRVGDIGGVTAVVERLEPPDVHDWFERTRSAYGVEVVALGDDDAMVRLLDAVKRCQIICLLADRDLGGNGLDVEFFGETTTLPAGPALLARRSGAPLLPTSVFFRGDTRVCRLGPPIRSDRSLRLRDDLAVTTQAIADGLAEHIDAHPGQWHVLQRIWPEAADADQAGGGEVAPACESA